MKQVFIQRCPVSVWVQRDQYLFLYYSKWGPPTGHTSFIRMFWHWWILWMNLYYNWLYNTGKCSQSIGDSFLVLLVGESSCGPWRGVKDRKATCNQCIAVLVPFIFRRPRCWHTGYPAIISPFFAYVESNRVRVIKFLFQLLGWWWF